MISREPVRRVGTVNLALCEHEIAAGHRPNDVFVEVQVLLREYFVDTLVCPLELRLC